MKENSHFDEGLDCVDAVQDGTRGEEHGGEFGGRQPADDRQFGLGPLGLPHFKGVHHQIRLEKSLRRQPVQHPPGQGGGAAGHQIGEFRVDARFGAGLEDDGL